ncbi:periodic tryptophan protein 1 homolog [Dendronephthya gigantea]|uniref:periodic tryptophan protein 1 homolog n=1 Tax=Dendronephthya gigantea TaxID=151771 RepID=UPI00106A8337|nr:periodic tryptophan protein 1 homolog [Dendronephthya gigantea]
MPSMVTCLTWVRRGVTKALPDKVELTQEELEDLIKETKEKIKEREGSDYDEEQMNEAISSQQDPDQDEELDNSDVEDNAVLKEYDLDNYDDDGEGVVMTGAGMAGLTYFANNQDDPYITLKEDDEDEKEDVQIKSTDNLIVIGKVDEELSSLDIYVYNEEDTDLYVHHDILLDTFPLVLEWLNFDIGNEDKQGNLLAVGTMEPFINIWDLDVIDAIDSALTLGEKKKNKHKKKSKGSIGHVDAVLDLSWNRNARNILCSGSADSTVVLWDLAEAKAVQALTHHNNKVQSVCWHPYEAQSLLTGSFDKTAQVVDCRSPEGSCRSWKLKGEVECTIWNHFSPFYFLASTDKGSIFCCDVRTNDPVFTLHAHDEAVTGIALSSQLPGCLVSVSQDKFVKVWDIENDKPSFIASRDMKMGSILNVSPCPDSPYIFTLGGEKQGLQIFDITQSAPAWKHFENRQCLVNVANAEPEGEAMVAQTKEETKETGIDDDMDVESNTVSAMESLSLNKDEKTSSDRKKLKRKKKKRK